jgi:hypothetical protein
MDWKECNEKRLVKKISVDLELVNSLKQTSKDKFASASLLELNETTASSIITLYYDSLRELLEAIAIMQGYKIYNHDCYSCFLAEILSEKDLSDRFDPIRKLRNSINYYGKRLSLEEAKTIIDDIKESIKKSKDILK